MSVWSSEDDTEDRMRQVVSAAKADSMERLDALTAKCQEVVKLLRDVAQYDANLSGEECRELAGLLEDALRTS